MAALVSSSDVGPALWIAALMGWTHAARNLLLGNLPQGQGSSVNIEERSPYTHVGPDGPNICTPHRAATDGGFVDTARILIEINADVHATGFNERTSLHSAVFHGNEAMVRLLLKHKADVCLRDLDGYTPIHEAARIGNAEMATLLIQRGADISEKDSDGVTALHLAGMGGYDAMVQLMIHHGANALAKTRWERTPKDLAQSDTVVGILEVKEVTRSKCVAFAMGHHQRSGTGSRVERLDPEVLRLVLVYVY